MTNQEFINKIKEYYSVARDLEFKEPAIKRGRKHSISSKVEDLTAYFISKSLNNSNLDFLIDYPISFKSKTKLTKKLNPASVTVYPDIAIVDKSKNYEIQHIIDLKLDIGWKRDFNDTLNKAITAVKELREVKFGSIKKLDEFGNKIINGEPIQFSKNLQWHIILISDQNIDEPQMKDNEKKAREASSNHPFNLYVFTREQHPNGGNPVIQNNEINRFVENLQLLGE